MLERRATDLGGGIRVAREGFIKVEIDAKLVVGHFIIIFFLFFFCLFPVEQNAVC